MVLAYYFTYYISMLFCIKPYCSVFWVIYCWHCIMSKSLLKFYWLIDRLVIVSIFIAEGWRPQNDTQVLSSSSGLLLLSHNLPASSQSSLLYHLPIVSLAFLCLLRHLDDLQKYVCRGSVLWSCAQSIAISVSLQWLHTKNLEHMTRRETFYKCSQGVP